MNDTQNLSPIALAMAAAQAKAGVVPDQAVSLPKDKPFEPMTYLGEVLNEPELRCRLLTTAVWALDQAIVDAAKSMYFEINSENPECKGKVGLLIDAYRGTYANEGYWGEGHAHQLVKLLAMQPSWHETATRAAQATGWLSYAPKSIDELVLAIKPMPIKSDAINNLRALAKMTADSTKHLEERYRLNEADVLKASVDAANKRKEDQAEFMRGLCPAINVFVEEARDHLMRQQLVDNTTIEFVDLPTRTQLSIASKIAGGINRARSDLAERLDSVAFGMCLAESMKAQQHLDHVVAKLVREMERVQG